MVYSYSFAKLGTSRFGRSLVRNIAFKYELINIHIMIILSYHCYQTCGDLHDLIR